MRFCSAGCQGSRCLIVGTLQGEEGEAQELDQLACLYTSYQLDTLSVTLFLAGTMTASLTCLCMAP